MGDTAVAVSAGVVTALLLVACLVGGLLCGRSLQTTKRVPKLAAKSFGPYDQRATAQNTAKKPILMHRECADPASCSTPLSTKGAISIGRSTMLPLTTPKPSPGYNSRAVQLHTCRSTEMRASLEAAAVPSPHSPSSSNSPTAAEHHTVTVTSVTSGSRVGSFMSHSTPSRVQQHPVHPVDSDRSGVVGGAHGAEDALVQSRVDVLSPHEVAMLDLLRAMSRVTD